MVSLQGRRIVVFMIVDAFVCAAVRLTGGMVRRLMVGHVDAHHISEIVRVSNIVIAVPE